MRKIKEKARLKRERACRMKKKLIRICKGSHSASLMLKFKSLSLRTTTNLHALQLLLSVARVGGCRVLKRSRLKIKQ